MKCYDEHKNHISIQHMPSVILPSVIAPIEQTCQVMFCELGLYEKYKIKLQRKKRGRIHLEFEGSSTKHFKVVAFQNLPFQNDIFEQNDIFCVVR